MDCQNSIPKYFSQQPSQVILLEAEPGLSRHDCIQQWLDDAQQTKANTWLLSCNRNQGGPWAGLKDLLSQLIIKIQTHAPELIIKHDYELVHILPALRRTISVRYLNLTDAPSDNKHLTYYAEDRVFRIIHGIVDLLRAWHQYDDSCSWVIACNDYDNSSILVRHFFAELMRRAGKELNLTLLLVTDVGTSEAVIADNNLNFITQHVKLSLVNQPTALISQQNIVQLAQELEQKIGQDEIELENSVPLLIYYCLLSDQSHKAINYQIQACRIYAYRGYYEDAIIYGEKALAQIKKYGAEDEFFLWELSEKLHDCYLITHQFEQALKMLEIAMQQTSNFEYLLRGCNRMAMLYTRYLDTRDLELAEAYLERGLENLLHANLSEPEKIYQTALSRRGLALIRYLQGKYIESIDICLSTYQQNNNLLGADKHLPHQALLLHNISIVYSALGSSEEALAYLTAAMEIDSNYSEYYNHRGNMYFRMKRFDDAINDYLKAIELSPPYPEVWTNLGQCYRAMGKMNLSINAYSKTLDLDPNQSLALVGRAQAYESLQQSEDALADYNAALAIDLNQPLVLANRAILHYDAERYQEALADLNDAILLLPDTADLYQNRAVVLTVLGRLEEAALDLKTYLQLNPDAEDRPEVESELLALQTL